jgi:intein/homing endonuclease
VEIDGDLAEIAGIHIGDGCISVTKRYSEYYLGGDRIEEKEYHDRWVGPLFNRKIMMPLYGREVTYKDHPKVGIYGFHIFDKKIVEFFGTLGIKSGPKINIRIPDWVAKDQELSKRFIRGLFDTDGTLYFSKNYSVKNPIHNRPKIKLDSVSLGLIQDIYNLLLGLGFSPRLRKEYQGKRNKNPFYGVILDTVKDIDLFFKVIGFKSSKHYTKWQVFKKLGYCPSYTTLNQRKEILNHAKLFNALL